MAAPLDSGEDQASELHEINVTPFIDVMLVLLIIFMVAAPLSTVDVGVDLPVAAAKPQARPDKPLFVTIKRDLALAVGNDAVAETQLAQTLDRASGMDRQQRLFLRADKGVPYGALMHVLNLLRGAGYLKVALVGLEGNDTVPAVQDPAVASPPAAPEADGARSPGPNSEMR